MNIKVPVALESGKGSQVGADGWLGPPGPNDVNGNMVPKTTGGKPNAAYLRHKLAISRQKKTKTDRETARERQRETQKQRDSERERARERERERERVREWESGRVRG